MEKEKNSKNIMDYATVTLLDAENAIEIIDQTKLPGTIELIRLKSAQEIWNAFSRRSGRRSAVRTRDAS